MLADIAAYAALAIVAIWVGTYPLRRSRSIKRIYNVVDADLRWKRDATDHYSERLLDHVKSHIDRSDIKNAVAFHLLNEHGYGVEQLADRVGVKAALKVYETRLLRRPNLDEVPE